MSWCTRTVSCLLPPRISRHGRRRMSTARDGSARGPLLALTALLWACAQGAVHADRGAGETLYRRGLLPSGEPVQATHEGGAVLRGADAACVSCHRRSGLG